MTLTASNKGLTLILVLLDISAASESLKLVQTASVLPMKTLHLAQRHEGLEDQTFPIV